MRLRLMDFQEHAVDDLVGCMRDAADAWRRRQRGQAVKLEAPTGSGKTIMATAAFERLIAGDDSEPGLVDATLLWLTDSPELNEQTRDKMARHATRIGAQRLTTLDARFDQAVLPAGVVFLNIQKLSRSSNLVRRGEGRAHTFWDAFKRTLQERPGQVWVVIDEAHRGMGHDPKNAKDAATIAQRFVLGWKAEAVPPAPLLLGISATPQRFDELIERVPRTTHRVVIRPGEVRESGLLKDRIVLHSPLDGQDADYSMLRLAALEWVRFRDAWRSQADGSKGIDVRPILVIQVEDAKGEAFSQTDLAAVVETVQDATGVRDSQAWAHAFQDRGSLRIGHLGVRHLDPSKIERDGQVRFVLFKTSLATGWDCPRAEVIMSFRRAQDATYIAQLVGRLVRTPLARRIPDHEQLNSVGLFLPHFAEAELRAVIEALRDAAGDEGPDIVSKRELVECGRDPAHAAAFETAEQLVTYAFPGRSRVRAVVQLLRLARKLEIDGIADDTLAAATDALLDELDRLRASLGDEITRLRVGQWSAEVLEPADTGVSFVGENLAGWDARDADERYREAGRRLGEDLHHAWVRRRVAEGVAIADAKIEVWAVATHGGTRGSLERVAGELLASWLREHQAAIDALPEVFRLDYDRLRTRGAEPAPRQLRLPERIIVDKADDDWEQHVFVAGSGRFPAELNGWETDTLGDQQADDAVVAWLRNIERKPWALSIPYELEGETRALYPDFLVFRREGDGMVVDIVDPHLDLYVDALPKAQALVTYARSGVAGLGRVLFLRKREGVLQALALHETAVGDAVLAATSHDELHAVFERYG